MTKIAPKSPPKTASKTSAKTPLKIYEQTNFFGLNQAPPPQPVQVQPPAKKPFVPPLYQALDAGDLRNNFMYLLRILINSANRQPNDPDSQRDFSNALMAELKIKRGLGNLELETRTAILKAMTKRS